MGITDSAQVIPTWVMLSQGEKEGGEKEGKRTRLLLS